MAKFRVIPHSRTLKDESMREEEKKKKNHRRRCCAGETKAAVIKKGIDMRFCCMDYYTSWSLLSS